MARPWSARCYGVARQREGSRQNSIGGSGVLSLRHFSGWFSLSLGAWVPKNLARRRMVSAGAMLLDRLGPPGFRFTDAIISWSPLKVKDSVRFEPRCSRSSERDSNPRDSAPRVVVLALHFPKLY
jgi:hypothetical protein